MTFFDKYSYKQKNYALIVLGLLLCAAVYKRSIKTTIESRTYRTELIGKLNTAKGADSEIRSKYAEIAQLNRLLGKENVSVEEVQQGFLNFFAQRANGLMVYEIDEVLNYQHPDFSINTHRIVLKGGYLNSLKFLYDLEKNFNLGKLLNVTFEYKKYTTEESKNLYTTILLQNYLRSS